MKLYTTIFKLGFVLLALFLGFACSDDEGIENRDLGYGFVQFKLQKMATRGQTQMEYLKDAHKITVTLRHDMESFNQTLAVEEIDDQMAEFGVRTEVAKLAVGNYEMLGFVVYNAMDERIYSAASDAEHPIEVRAEALTLHPLLVDVRQRGEVRFKIVKDLSDFTRAEIDEKRTYTFDQVGYMDVELTNTRTGDEIKAREIACKFVKDDKGSSHLECPETLEAIAGDYRLDNYILYNTSKQILTVVNTKEDEIIYTIHDNEVNEVQVAVKISRSAAYINDYVYLKKIWEALDGEHWSWVGDAAPVGSNWNFNKDIDLWGQQPGVSLHTNGRVAALNLGGFNPKGEVPECLGELSELTQLWFGEHTDHEREDMEAASQYNLAHYSTWSRYMKGERLSDFIWDLTKEEMQSMHARKNAEIIGEHAANSQSEALWSARQPKGFRATSTLVEARPYELIQIGQINNRITKLPESIGRLRKLEALYIANGLVEQIPASIRSCMSLTDLEIYNCPKMTQFPDAIASLTNLEKLNMAGNPSISGEEFTRGLTLLFNGRSKSKIQMIYLTGNNIEVFPENAKNLTALGLLDLADNKLHTIHAFGENVSLVQLYLDNNRLTSLPKNFFKMDDCEFISASNNRFTSMPNIFSADTPYYIGTIDFSCNRIEKIDGYNIQTMTLEPDAQGEVFRGVKATHLKLESNRLRGAFPAAFSLSKSDVAHYDISNNLLDSIGTKGLQGLNYTLTLVLSSNRIKEAPQNSLSFNLGLQMPFLEGVDLSFNRFEEFPESMFAPQGIAKFYFSSQMGVVNEGEPNETVYCSFKKWPDGIETYNALRELRLDGNDIRHVQTFPMQLDALSINGNENISINIPELICLKIQQGTFKLVYEPWQTGITGCPALGIEN